MLGTKIGFDLGTSNVLAYVEGKGIKINEPSVIAYDTFDDKIKALGKEAYKMIGRSPDSLTVIRPIRNGTVYNYDAVQNMMSIYIQKICGTQIFKPNVLISVPSNVSELDKRTILDLATSSGAAKACIIEEPLVAAVGAGISDEFRGTMIVDIGGGTTDIAVISGGLVAMSASVNIAGNTFDNSIRKFARKKRKTIIGHITAEKVKIEVGAAKMLDAELAVRAVGKDTITKLPKSIELTSTDVFEAIKPNLDLIVEKIRLVLQDTPPELNADVSINGIVLAGGGALLNGIDEYIENKLCIRTYCAENPLECVVNGIGYYLKNMDELERKGYVFKTFQDINEFVE